MSLMLDHDVFDPPGMDIEMGKEDFARTLTPTWQAPKAGVVRWLHLVASRHGRGTAETAEAP